MARPYVQTRVESIAGPAWLARLTDVYRTRRPVILGVLAAVVLVPIGLAVFLRGRAASEREAQATLSRGEQEFYSGTPAAAATFYQDVLDRFDGTPSADFAQLGLGRVALVQGKASDAVAAFAKVMDSKTPLVAVAAKRGRAAAEEDLGKNAAAATEYDALAHAETGEDAVGDLLAAARAYRAAGNAAQAKAALTTITTDHTDSPRLRDAEMMLAELR